MPGTADRPTLADCRREIERLHDFFVDYYTGQTDEFTRLADALAEEFEMVSPAGDRLDREAVLGLVDSKAETYAAGTFDITIRNVEVIDSGPGYAVARYEEHQQTPEGADARLSTVLFHADSATPGGLSWVTVHETWLDGGQ